MDPPLPQASSLVVIMLSSRLFRGHVNNIIKNKIYGLFKYKILPLVKQLNPQAGTLAEANSQLEENKSKQESIRDE